MSSTGAFDSPRSIGSSPEKQLHAAAFDVDYSEDEMSFDGLSEHFGNACNISEEDQAWRFRVTASSDGHLSFSNSQLAMRRGARHHSLKPSEFLHGFNAPVVAIAIVTTRPVLARSTTGPQAALAYALQLSKMVTPLLTPLLTPDLSSDAGPHAAEDPLRGVEVVSPVAKVVPDLV